VDLQKTVVDLQKEVNHDGHGLPGAHPREIGATPFLPLTPTFGVQETPCEFGGMAWAVRKLACAESCRGFGGPDTRIVT
jgi:hypothetical protein